MALLCLRLLWLLARCSTFLLFFVSSAHVPPNDVQPRRAAHQCTRPCRGWAGGRMSLLRWLSWFTAAAAHRRSTGWAQNSASTLAQQQRGLRGRRRRLACSGATPAKQLSGGGATERAAGSYSGRGGEPQHKIATRLGQRCRSRQQPGVLSLQDKKPQWRQWAALSWSGARRSQSKPAERAGVL